MISLDVIFGANGYRCPVCGGPLERRMKLRGVRVREGFAPWLCPSLRCYVGELLMFMRIIRGGRADAR